MVQRYFIFLAINFHSQGIFEMTVLLNKTGHVSCNTNTRHKQMQNENSELNKQKIKDFHTRQVLNINLAA